MSYCHIWNNLWLLGILFSISLVVFAENQIYWQLNQNLWLVIIVLYLSIIIPFYWGKKKTVKIIEKETIRFSDPDTGDSESHDLVTEQLGRIKTCECLHNKIKEGETVTLKCYGFGIPIFRYFAYDIIGKEDAIRTNGNKKSY
jgi:hypothetical protein